jgi:uncharacterized protein (DUF342 family)
MPAISSDGRIDIRVSDDKMTAYVDIIPPTGKGRPVELPTVFKALEAAGIIYGIDGDNILETFDKNGAGRLAIKDIVAARGTPPRDEAPEYIKLKKKFFTPHTLLGDSDANRIDYRMVSPFVVVDPGEVVAKRVPSVPGTPGSDVMGGEIPFGVLKFVKFEVGAHLEETDGLIKAAMPGCFERQGNKIQINETLSIAGDVDYRTGHITFTGDVIIFGTIKDGFRVSAGGSVYCKKTLDASEVLCRKDLVVEGGIIGRKKALVRVHGKIETRFIQYCDVESLQGISVKSAVLHSELFTLGELVMGDKGGIVGSTIRAEKGCILQNVGREGNPPSLIICGTSFVTERKYNHVTRQRERLMEDLEKVRKLPGTAKNLELTQKIEAALEKMSRHAEEFFAQLNSSPEAEIVVKGVIQPGNIFRICGREYEVNEKIDRTRFKYNSEKKIIERAPL